MRNSQFGVGSPRARTASVRPRNGSSEITSATKPYSRPSDSVSPRSSAWKYSVPVPVSVNPSTIFWMDGASCMAGLMPAAALRFRTKRSTLRRLFVRRRDQQLRQQRHEQLQRHERADARQRAEDPAGVGGGERRRQHRGELREDYAAVQDEIDREAEELRAEDPKEEDRHTARRRGSRRCRRRGGARSPRR